MSRRQAQKKALVLALLGSFVFAFICCSAKQIWFGLHDGMVGNAGDEFHSCDLYLDLITHRPRLAARFSSALHALPSDRPIAIVMHEKDSVSGMLGMLSAYLSWPRAVRMWNLDRDPVTPRTNDYAATIYCNLELPAQPDHEYAVTVSRNFRIALSPVE